MTEGHLVLRGRNRNELMSSWAVGVTYAKWHNLIMRHSDILDIATMADFFGNVWLCNAIMIPTPMRERSRCYLMPVAEVMRLFGAHQGRYALDISSSDSLDTVASRTDNKIFIHAANTSMTSSETVSLKIDGAEIHSARIFYIAQDPRQEITPLNIGCFKERSEDITPSSFSIPAASVSAIEITLK